MARSAKHSVTRNYLEAIPTPARDETYAPVPFAKVARICDEVTSSIGDQYQRENVSYYLNGSEDELLIQHRLFSDDKELGLSYEFMGSHNKQVANHFYGSNSVVWCNNGMQMSDAEVHWAGKHTVHKVTELEEAAWSVLAGWQATTEQAEGQMEAMKETPVDDNRFYEYTGLLYGNDVIKPHQLPKVHAEWHQPRHEAFQPRNLWSAYNSVTEIFKNAPIRGHRERHTALTDLTMSF